MENGGLKKKNGQLAVAHKEPRKKLAALVHKEPRKKLAVALAQNEQRVPAKQDCRYNNSSSVWVGITVHKCSEAF